MGTYKEVEGDLIDLALQGEFDVIAHGANCFCTMGAGIAPIMAENFGCDRFRLENTKYKGSILKLGQIDFEGKMVVDGEVQSPMPEQLPNLYVVNAYTQYGFGRNHSDGISIPLNYPALTLCLIKINHLFKGKKIGLPQIGCGLAGGDWKQVQALIKTHLVDCDVTVVIFDGQTTMAQHELEEETED
jgi:O-acetyl-ADP-ribose deacetylase (regulator of RNase III)